MADTCSTPAVDPSSITSTPSFQPQAAGAFCEGYVNINQHGNFLGIPQQVARTHAQANIRNGVIYATTCPPGFAHLILNLHNQELNGRPTIMDPANTVSANSSNGTFTVPDSGGSTPNGHYVFPSDTGCIPQNVAYTMSTSSYAGSATLAIASENAFDFDFDVNWNSASDKTPSPAGVQVNRGIAHLVDTVSLLDDASLNGRADNPHFWAPFGYNDVCDNPIGGNSSVSKICQANLNEDCTGSSPRSMTVPTRG